MGIREMTKRARNRNDEKTVKEATQYQFSDTNDARSELEILGGRNFLDDAEMMRVEGFDGEPLSELAMTSLVGWLSGVAKAAEKWRGLMSGSKVAAEAIDAVMSGVKKAQAIASKGEARNVRDEIRGYTRR